jgi:hypothetical protein
MTKTGQATSEVQMMSMSSMSAYRAVALACVTMAPLVATPVWAANPASFNGTWSVLIMTDKGSCDRAYRYPVRVANGRVSYAGQADFDVNGSVRPNGAVNVTVTKGRQRASGSGRLQDGSGFGRWRGGSGPDACSGTWTAEKRG